MKVKSWLVGVLVLIAALVAGPMGLAGPPAWAKPARTPEPVLMPPAADPGVYEENGQYYAYFTGGLVQVATARSPRGPWQAVTNEALTRWPAWAAGTGAPWAPDVDRTPAGYVLWFAAQATGFSGQRCIGTAVSASPLGPFEPSDAPLICPILQGEDPVAGRPDITSGVIDPAPFVDSDGRRYLTYKTQKVPGTLRMIELTEDGLHVAPGAVSQELFRHVDSIENPVMVKRGQWYVLFASANWYDQCRYETVYRRSTDLWSFADKSEHVILSQASTGLCGPGGADVVITETGDAKIFFHGWLCPPDWQTCQYEGLVPDPKRRAMYSGVLAWGDDGASPKVATILRPAKAR